MSSSISTYNCISCLKAKMTKLPFPMSLSTSLTPLELVHSDVWGPFLIISSNGNRYYVSFVDNFSKFTWLFPIAYKSDVPSIVQKFVPLIENQIPQKLKRFQSDSGGEFCNTTLQSFFYSKGIFHQKSCPYTSEQNGIAERKHRHIVETAMSLIFHSSVPLEFWPYAFSIAVFLINRMSSSSLKMLSPFEMLFGYTRDLHHLKVFGCACYPLLKPYTKHKLEPKTTQHVFIGYPHNFKGYICYNPLTKQTIVSRHVIFHETIFPYANSTNSSPSQSLSISDPSILLTLLNIPQHIPLNSVLIPNIQSAPIRPPTVDITCSSFMDTNATCQSLNVLSTVDTGNEINATTINLPDPPPPRNTHVMQTRAKSGIFKPKAFHITTALPTPTSYTKASKYP
ncbi:hypothetical protein IC575_008499 [Cucumis melo]